MDKDMIGFGHQFPITVLVFGNEQGGHIIAHLHLLVQATYERRVPALVATSGSQWLKHS